VIGLEDWVFAPVKWLAGNDVLCVECVPIMCQN